MTLNSRETDQHLLDSYGAPTACWSPFRQQSDVPGSLKEPPAWHAAARGFRSQLQPSTDGTCTLLQLRRVWDQPPHPPPARLQKAQERRFCSTAAGALLLYLSDAPGGWPFSSQSLFFPCTQPPRAEQDYGFGLWYEATWVRQSQLCSLLAKKPWPSYLTSRNCVCEQYLPQGTLLRMTGIHRRKAQSPELKACTCRLAADIPEARLQSVFGYPVLSQPG